ncbi:hypothetical protein M5K25_000466 [Dendrobium thyrsiflorum]|uniref:MADS-box domain-containing protein n=1 Tax=Dendrobium thyrsiflorum TaxID=117978 RepID=A0ABD0VTY7_DENTH
MSDVISILTFDIITISTFQNHLNIKLDGDEAMGRTKHKIKYIEQSWARINAYKIRIKEMEKKTKELTVLYNVNVLFASFSPDLKRVSFSIVEFDFPRRLVAINIKLEVVKQRISFLDVDKISSLSQTRKNDSMEEKDDCCSCSTIINEDDNIYSMLEELGDDVIVSDLPSILFVNICSEILDLVKEKIKYFKALARVNTYKMRIKLMKKKAKDLFVLYGDVLFISFFNDLKVIHCWPKEPSKFHRIINRYKFVSFMLEKKNRAKEFSILSGVDVLFASFSPNFKVFHYWLKEPSKFCPIINHYKFISSQKPPCVVSSPPLNSSS